MSYSFTYTHLRPGYDPRDRSTMMVGSVKIVLPLYVPLPPPMSKRPPNSETNAGEETWNLTPAETTSVLWKAWDVKSRLFVTGQQQEVEENFQSLGFPIALFGVQGRSDCFEVGSYHRERRLVSLVALAQQAQAIRGDAYDIANIAFCFLAEQALTPRSLRGSICKAVLRTIITEDRNGNYPNDAHYDLIDLDAQIALKSKEDDAWCHLSIPVPLLRPDVAFTLAKGAQIIDREAWKDVTNLKWMKRRQSTDQEPVNLWHELFALIPPDELQHMLQRQYLANWQELLQKVQQMAANQATA